MDHDFDQTRRLLHGYRPGSGETGDPQVDAALRASADDEAVAQFLKEEEAFDRMFAAKLRATPVPTDLPERILAAMRSDAVIDFDRAARETSAAERDNERPRRGGYSWLHFAAFGAAAGVVAALALNFTFNGRQQPAQVQMVAQQQPAPLMAAAHAGLPSGEWIVQRIGEYINGPREMHQGSGLSELSHVLVSNNAPVPRSLPRSLQPHAGFACTTLLIDGIPVSMVCFKQSGSTYHLFTIDRASLPGFESVPQPRMTACDGHNLAYWTSDDQVYVLAGRCDERKLREMF